MRFRYRRHPTVETVGLSLIFLVALVGSTVYFTRDLGEPDAPESEANWSPLNSGIASTLLDVDFVDSTTGWAVGQDGTIIATTDGGHSWHVQESGFELTLRGVDFVDPMTGWVVGHLGLILHTRDGGRTWTVQGADEAFGQNLIEVSFSGPRKGWIIAERGGFTLKTEDGGSTWNRVFFDSTQTRSAAFILDADHAWVALNSGGVLSTSDGGDSWTGHKGVNQVEIGTSGMYLLDTQTGWIAGWRGKQRGVSSGVQFVKYLTDGMVARTTDGGLSWSRVDSDTGHFLWDVAFPTISEGWAVGSFGLVMRSTDGGITWKQHPSGVEAGLRRVTFIDPDTGWAVGEEGVVLGFTRE